MTETPRATIPARLREWAEDIENWSTVPTAAGINCTIQEMRAFADALSDPRPPAPDVDAIRQREQRATAGPWQIIERRYDDDGSGKGICGKVAERRIFTTWDHPQLHGPTGVVNGAVTIWPVDGEKPRHLVSISEADAEFIVHARQDIPDLLDRVSSLSAQLAQAEQERDALQKTLMCNGAAVANATDPVTASTNETALRMKLRPALAQLRHAYWNLTHDHWPRPMPVAQQREFAEGLIAPQIRRLEEMEVLLTGEGSASDARLTDSESGKADGSATNSSVTEAQATIARLTPPMSSRRHQLHYVQARAMHLDDRRQPEGTACGRPALLSHRTPRDGDVTCRNCLRSMARAEKQADWRRDAVDR